MKSVELSVIIPVLNEEESLELLYSKLTSVLERLDKAYEILIIDDGSTDRSFEVLARLHQQDNRLKVIRFRRNFGQTSAFSAGFDHAQGDILITLDADLQNDPEDIPRILEKMSEGHDVVSGWRVDRKEPFFSRRLPSKIVNFLVSRISGVQLHDYGCSLKAYRSEVMKEVKLYGQMHRFIPAVAGSAGISVAELPVSHHSRKHGSSKYGLSRTPVVLLDLVTIGFLLSYSTRPMQIFGRLGLLSFFIGLALGIYLVIDKFAFNHGLAERPLLMLAILLVIAGVQLITMGLLGELIVRTYHEAQNKPTYVIKEIIE
ncbi:glycosyltransferase family 2 protein [Chloroflexota bacterium]